MYLKYRRIFLFVCLFLLFNAHRNTPIDKALINIYIFFCPLRIEILVWNIRLEQSTLFDSIKR